ncbi:MAG: hypothetical protein HFJ81_06705 [Clostridia bacterium]|nr:hypothetical protein [Clostridia bacterium]
MLWFGVLAVCTAEPMSWGTVWAIAFRVLLGYCPTCGAGVAVARECSSCSAIVADIFF